MKNAKHEAARLDRICRQVWIDYLAEIKLWQQTYRAEQRRRKNMTHPFPYPIGTGARRLTAKPAQYKGWTIYRYQAWCLQTGAKRGWWEDMALAVNADKDIILGGDLYAQIDARQGAARQPPA